MTTLPSPDKPNRLMALATALMVAGYAAAMQEKAEK